MHFIAKLALATTAAAALALGTVQPATAAPTQATAAPATWDCDTQGVKQCAGSLKGIGDAWESFDSLAVAPRYDRTHVLAYVKTVHTYPLTRSLVVKSAHIPHTWHVFTYKK
jgi:hypothetical protein